MAEKSASRHRRGRSAFAWYLLMLCALALGIPAGCAVGPNFKPPAAPANAGFTPAGSTPPTVTASAPVAGRRGAALRRRPGHSRPVVDAVPIARTQRPDRARAQAESDARVRAGGAARRPTRTWPPSAERCCRVCREPTRRSATAAPWPRSVCPVPAATTTRLNSANVNVSYTLDAFGGIRRQIEALQAQAEYARSSRSRRATSRSPANVVTAAITEASLRAQIAADGGHRPARSSPQLDITQRRVTAGGASRTDVLQQQATLQATLATLAGAAHPARAGARSAGDLRRCAARRVRRLGVSSRRA